MVKLLPAQVFWCTSLQPVLAGQCSVETSRAERCAPSAGPWGPTRPWIPPQEQLQKVARRDQKGQIARKKHYAVVCHYLVGQRMGHGDPSLKTKRSDAPLTRCFASSEKDWNIVEKRCMAMTLATASGIRKFFWAGMPYPDGWCWLERYFEVYDFTIRYPSLHKNTSSNTHPSVSYTWLQLILPKENKATTNR